jgi:hypothetical protein
MGNVPVPDLPVELHSIAGDYTTTTDSGGNFLFSDVSVGTVNIQTYDPATQSGAGAVVTVVAGQNVNQNLTLSQGTGSVAGTVRDQFGVPVPGASVTVTAVNGSFSLTTAGDGTYSLSGVQVGPLLVKATNSSNGTQAQQPGFLDLAGTTVIIDVLLPPPQGGLPSL